MGKYRHLHRTAVGLAVLTAVQLGPEPTALQAAQAHPASDESATSVEPSPPSSPDRFVRLEVREHDLILSNNSSRAINAWIVKHVVRSSQGNESFTTLGMDAYRSPIFPDGEERLLEPGESITLDKAPEPWVREDHRGPGFAVFYEVGALTFVGGGAVGDQDLVDRIFERRLDQARVALKALQVTTAADAGEAGALDDLPPQYQHRLEFLAGREDALQTLQSDAWDDYRIAVENLRPQDLEDLPLPEEVMR